jgi:two-component system, OmpR family, heavy metal sensor histidine kinase CusS
MALGIRWRLTLWNLLALAVVLLGFSFLVYGLLAETLYERLDRTLESELHELEGDSRLASDPHGRLAHWIEEFHEHEKVLCVVYDTQGQVYEKSEVMPQGSVPPMPALIPEERRSSDSTLPIVGRQRLLAARLHLGDGDYTVLLLASLEDTDQELGELLAVLLVAVPGALILAAVLGYLLARKALAPMEKLHRLTEEITADRLDRRLPVGPANDELTRLSRTINAMIARLEQSFAEIRRFTADASHELRTPLAAIRAEAEVALGQPLSTADHQQLLGSILEECERLTRLTDQLLALSREDAGSARQVREPLDLAAVAAGVAETMRPLTEARGLGLQVHGNGPLPIRGDAVRLREVFYNVLDNAIKYTPAGGTIAVTMEQHDAVARVTVRDTGSGIPPEHLPRVFDRFYRVDKARSREQGGTGLGLSITRSIVTAHGGKVELASAPGQGTTCTVTLALADGRTQGEGGNT